MPRWTIRNCWNEAPNPWVVCNLQLLPFLYYMLWRVCFLQFFLLQKDFWSWKCSCTHLHKVKHTHQRNFIDPSSEATLNILAYQKWQLKIPITKLVITWWCSHILEQNLALWDTIIKHHTWVQLTIACRGETTPLPNKKEKKSASQNNLISKLKAYHHGSCFLAPTGQSPHNNATSCAAKEREKNPTKCSSKWKRKNITTKSKDLCSVFPSRDRS